MYRPLLLKRSAEATAPPRQFERHLFVEGFCEPDYQIISAHLSAVGATRQRVPVPPDRELLDRRMPSLDNDHGIDHARAGIEDRPNGVFSGIPAEGIGTPRIIIPLVDKSAASGVAALATSSHQLHTRGAA